jgi:hypothetical protein
VAHIPGAFGSLFHPDPPAAFPFSNRHDLASPLDPQSGSEDSNCVLCIALIQLDEKFPGDSGVLGNASAIRRASEFAIGQCFQENRVNKHCGGLSDYAYRVFDTGEINARFPSDGCVGHCQQRGRNLNEINASFPCSCAKAAHITDYTSTQVHEQ